MADDTPLSAEELATMRAEPGWSLLPRRLLATIAAVERERDEALAGIARVEALCADAERQAAVCIANGGVVCVQTGEVRSALAATNPSGGAE